MEPTKLQPGDVFTTNNGALKVILEKITFGSSSKPYFHGWFTIRSTLYNNDDWKSSQNLIAYNSKIEPYTLTQSELASLPEKAKRLIRCCPNNEQEPQLTILQTRFSAIMEEIDE